MDNEKILCHTPTPDKQPTRIQRWKYNVVREAILKAIPPGDAGIRFDNLPEEVEKLLNLNLDERARLGSIGWYTTVVKLDLEVKGEIKRIPGSKPQRLIRV